MVVAVGTKWESEGHTPSVSGIKFILHPLKEVPIDSLPHGLRTSTNPQERHPVKVRIPLSGKCGFSPSAAAVPAPTNPALKFHKCNNVMDKK